MTRKFVYMGVEQGTCRHHFMMKPLDAKRRSQQVQEAWEPGGTMADAVAWCVANIGRLDDESWTHSGWSIRIADEKNAIAFRLTWSE